jgi:hypothetical protein
VSFPGRLTRNEWIATAAAVLAVLLVFFLGIERAFRELKAGADWFFKGINLTILALIGLVVFRTQIVALFNAVISAIPDRAVTVDVGTVKLQISERVVEGSDDQRVFFSPSPFEIDDETVRDPSAVLREIGPQLNFQYSDYAAQRFVAQRAPAGVVRQAEAAFEKFREDCDQGLDGTARADLAVLARALEATHFLHVGDLGDFLQKRPDVFEFVKAFPASDMTKGTDTFASRHAAAEGLLRRACWKQAHELLDSMVWAGDKPVYLPAAPAWLVSRYHLDIGKMLDEEPDRALEASPLSDYVEKLLQQGRMLIDAIRDNDWKTFSQPANKDFYTREINKDYGLIVSLVAEFSTPAQRDRHYTDARPHLELCAAPIGTEPETALDHNNLADLYRQLAALARANGDPARADDYSRLAHSEIGKALATDAPGDPAFHHTRALIFYGQQRPLSALQALETYGEAEAARSGVDGQDIEQYVDNQILAVRLISALDASRDVPDPARMAYVLERALRFLAGVRGKVEASADRLQADLEEMLAFTYLQWPGHEDKAASAFERLFSVRTWQPRPPVRFRCLVGRARALTGLARAQRRNYSTAAASLHRRTAGDVLATLLAMKDQFPVDTTTSPTRRTRNIPRRLDAVLALQALSAEYLAAGELTFSSALAETETLLLASIESALRDRGDADAARWRRELLLSRARQSFRSGRVLIRTDPALGNADLVAQVETLFQAARGATDELNCRIDLELGALLLTAAAAGKGAADDLSRRGVEALERAAGCDAPALRGEVVRALSSGYARRSAILRRTKRPETKAS